jgi:hypothetical protein
VDAEPQSLSGATRGAESSLTLPRLGSAAELLLVAGEVPSVADPELLAVLLVAWDETIPSSRFPWLALLNALRISADEKARISFL